MSFTLTLFSKKDNRSSEIKVKGNTIPRSIREQLNLETKTFLIEYIRAQDELGTSKLLEAISVNIE
jgi:bifunctional DNA-binding transcriptional regulator/antitoxin component of YhaV-PrlF toxin-antitoxin module